MFKKIYNLFHHHYHHRYHGQYRHAKKLFVFDMVLLVAGILTLAASLFFFFWKPGITDWIDLNVSYGDGRIKSGEKVKMIIDYTNRSDQKLTNVTLAVHLPPGFIIDRELTPANEFSDQSIFTLSDLHPGAKGEKTINGWLWTEPKNEVEVISILSYTPEKTKRSEQKFGSFFVNLPESVVKTATDFSVTSAFPAVKLPINLTLTNIEKYPLENISIDCAWVDNISWQNNVEKIALDKDGTKNFAGEITMPKKAGVYTLKIQPQILINNKLIKLDTITKEISVVYPSVISNVKFKNPVSYLEPGQQLPIQIYWKNNSNYELKNLRIKINTTAGVVNLKETARENNLKIIGDSLVLDASNRTLLANGAPTSEGSSEINLILLPSFNVGEKEKAYLEITPIFEAELKEVSGQTFANTGDIVKALLATNVHLNAEARYFTPEGDQLGRGPIPPRVGETTKYWIFAQLQNTTNKLQDVTFNSTLASGVQFTGRQSVTVGSPLQTNNGQLTWNYYQLPANSVTGWYFEVSVTPTAEQIGKNLTLVKNINITATDKETGKKFNVNTGEINNVLSRNDSGSSAGSKVE